MGKKIILMVWITVLCIMFIPTHIEASTPAHFKIEGKTTLEQGENVQYKMVVTSGTAIFFDGEVYFSGDALSEDIFEFISFESTMGATYDSSTGQIYLTGEESLAASVEPGDILAIINLKVKDDAKVGEVKWLEGSLLENTITITRNSNDDPVSNENNTVDENDETNNENNTVGEEEKIKDISTNDENKNINDFLIGVIVGMAIIIVGLTVYIVTLKKNKNIVQ